MANSEFVADAINMLITELGEKALAEKRESDPEFNEKLKLMDSLSKEIANMDISETVKSKIEELKSVILGIEMEQREYLYIQGIKDGAVLLKKIGVI